MVNIREILRLHFTLGLSNRAIARSLSVSRSSVSDTLSRTGAERLTWTQIEAMDDGALEAKLYPRSPRTTPTCPSPDPAYIDKELRRKAVTLQLLWNEYRAEYPDGYSYSRYCEIYRDWKDKADPCMRQVHRAGERAMVDWAGMTMPIVDLASGGTSKAHVFVATLPATNYIYAEAFPSEELDYWIAGHVHAFSFFSGVPKIIVPDNAGTATTRYCFYEPELHSTYLDMAMHYGVAIIPTRPRAPRDKAKVETGVQIVERSVLAPLRNHTFHSIAELNAEIFKRVEALNNKAFQKLPGTRTSMFNEIERPVLRPLPPAPYELARFKKAKVSTDYHIQVDYSFYSVPYQLIGTEVDVRYTATTIEVLHKGKRVASHIRSRKKGEYSTLAEHMPARHRKTADSSPSRLIKWADGVGEGASAFVKAILESKPHPEQGYRACLGIMRLSGKYSACRVDAACARAFAAKALSYRSVRTILEKGLDNIPFDIPKDKSPICHKNVRGPAYFK